MAQTGFANSECQKEPSAHWKVELTLEVGVSIDTLGRSLADADRVSCPVAIDDARFHSPPSTAPPATLSFVA